MLRRSHDISRELFSALDCLLPLPRAIAPAFALRTDVEMNHRNCPAQHAFGVEEADANSSGLRDARHRHHRHDHLSRSAAWLSLSPCPRRGWHGQGLAMRSSASTPVLAAPEARPRM